MGEESLEKVFLNSKPARIMVSLRRQTTENYPTALARQADTTYSHTLRILERLKSHELVEFSQKGRKKIVSLTDRGRKIAEKLSHLLQQIQNDYSL